MTRSIFLAALLLASAPPSALAVTLIQKSSDDVHHKTAYHARITSTAFHQYTNEDYLDLECDADGSAYLSWWQGGHFSGGPVLPSIKVDYTFDGGRTVSIVMDDLTSGSDLPKFYAELLKRKRLSIISEFMTQSSTFELSDVRAKIGPGSAIAKQCARSLIGSKNVSADAQPGKVGPIPVAGNGMPPYPEISRRLGESGTTVLKLRIAQNGMVSGAAVAQSSGSPRLDAAAADYVKEHWLYRPLTNPSDPADSEVQVSIPWVLPKTD